VAAADKATDPALQTTNSLLDENAAQLAKIAALMGVSVDYLKSLNDNSAKTDLSWLRSMAGF
jgi:sulfatase maturation enzyme AslB (radical SAM superfamily)